MRKYQSQLLIFFTVMVIIGIMPTLKLPGGYRFFVVESDSMEPTIKTKSVVITLPKLSYQTGDIITFLDPDANGSKYPTTTHRLQLIINQNGNVAYMTKGDKNKLSDEQFVPQDNVVGKVIKIIPFWGWPINIVKSTLGTILLIFLPAFLIIRNEITGIINLTRYKSNI